MVKFADKMKWLYTFTLLLITIGWATFTVLIVRACMTNPTTVGVLEASGASVLLGTLITLNTNCNQYYFRKRTPDTVEPE